MADGRVTESLSYLPIPAVTMFGQEDQKRFWELGDRLVGGHAIVIDCAGGSAPLRYLALIYPFNYGYLDGTGAIDGNGVDCWRGSLESPSTTGAIVTVDVMKADSEVKWLVGCMESEMQAALATHQTEWQAAMLILR
ncbi:MAG: inorganic pyrophosphatase [Thermomicrobiales bacterium]